MTYNLWVAVLVTVYAAASEVSFVHAFSVRAYKTVFFQWKVVCVSNVLKDKMYVKEDF